MAFSGCVYMIIGGVAAAGGYAISRDTIEGQTAKTFDTAWDAAIEITEIMGYLESESYEMGTISSIINGARVTVTVSQLTTDMVRIRVKARKALFPSIANAQDVFIKIMDKING
jgi:hypothetical protein